MKGTVETTVFAEISTSAPAPALQPGTVIEVRGRVNLREDAEPKLVLSTVKRLGGLEETGAVPVHIDLAEAAARLSRSRRSETSSFATRGEPCILHRAGEERAPAPPDPRQAPACAPGAAKLLQALRERLGESAVRVANGHAGGGPLLTPERCGTGTWLDFESRSSTSSARSRT